MLILAFNDQRFIHLPSYYRARGTTADSTMRKRADVQEALNRLSATESRAWGIKRFLDYVAARDEVCVPVCVCVRARGELLFGEEVRPRPGSVHSARVLALLAYPLCSLCLLPAARSALQTHDVLSAYYGSAKRARRLAWDKAKKRSVFTQILNQVAPKQQVTSPAMSRVVSCMSMCVCCQPHMHLATSPTRKPPPPRLPLPKQDIIVVGDGFRGCKAWAGAKHTPVLQVTFGVRSWRGFRFTLLQPLVCPSPTPPTSVRHSLCAPPPPTLPRHGVPRLSLAQSLLKFFEKHRRVVYVNEFRTSKCCAHCDQELRQVSNRCVPCVPYCLVA